MRQQWHQPLKTHRVGANVTVPERYASTSASACASVCISISTSASAFASAYTSAFASALRKWSWCNGTLLFGSHLPLFPLPPCAHSDVPDDGPHSLLVCSGRAEPHTLLCGWHCGGDGVYLGVQFHPLQCASIMVHGVSCCCFNAGLSVSHSP